MINFQTVLFKPVLMKNKWAALVETFSKHFLPSSGIIISIRIPKYNTAYRIQESKKTDNNEITIPIQKYLPRKSAPFLRTPAPIRWTIRYWIAVTALNPI